MHRFVYIPVREQFSFAKIIHPPDRCGISRSWLNSVIITQVHLVLGTIKGHSKMCGFVTQHNATDVSSFEGACNWHADCRNGLSTRAVARELNVNFSTKSHLQRRFREFGSTSNRSHNRRPHITTPLQDLHIWLLHLQDRLRGSGWGAEENFWLVIKHFCGEKLILNIWAWFPSGWAWLQSG